MLSVETQSIHSTVLNLKKSFESGKTLDVDYRKLMLLNLAQGFKEMQTRFYEALTKDIRNPLAFHTFANTFYSLSGLNESIKNIRKWTKPIKIETLLVMAPASSYVQPEPFGVVLLEGNWDYPLSNIINNLAPAIAAGNCVVVKPSEVCPETSHLIAELINKYLDKDYYCCIEGGPEVSKALVSEPFDMIMFMGTIEKGKEVAKAAAENLTPCVLLLGGKNPAIVNREANIDNAALRVARGRLVNTGQSWKGVDYIFIHKEIKDQFVHALQEKIKQFYGDDPLKSVDYGRMVSTAHTERLKSFLDEDHGGKILLGGEVDIAEKYVAPTIILNPHNNSKLMKEEVFGPIFNLVEFDHIDTVVKFINHRPKPPMMYYFGSDKSEAFNELKKYTSSGTLVCNESIMVVLNNHLPLGGSGSSGYGKWNGYNSFKSFSHMKSVMICNTNNSFPKSVFFPPYNTELLQKVLNFSGKISSLKQSHLWYVVGVMFIVFFLLIMMKKNRLSEVTSGLKSDL